MAVAGALFGLDRHYLKWEEIEVKTKTVLTFALLIFCLGIFACAPTKQASMEVSCEDFTKNQHISREVKFAVDGSLTITLCSNPTTGRQWPESAEISDQTVLRQTDHELVMPGPESPPGTPGKEIWTFKTLKAGESTISMEWSQPWEGGVKAEWTFDLTVVVE